MAQVTLRCPTPGLSVPMPPYFVTVKAAKDAQGRHEADTKSVKGHGSRQVVEDLKRVRVGAPIVKGKVTEPGPVKRLVFDADGKCVVDKDAWEAFSKNGAHTSYGITVE